MFVLAVLKENIKLNPAKLRHDLIQAIMFAVNKKYCNKVIINVGLCISVFDILEAGDPYVHSGKASAFVEIFRPFVGEVIEGKVRNSSEEGIHVSLGFFDDILIPPSCMQPDTMFDPTEQVWTWNYHDTKMFLDSGEIIRFRVLDEQFEEAAPTSKEVLMATRAANLNPLTDTILPKDSTVSRQPTPYKLIGSIAEDGLGLARWWEPANDGGDSDSDRYD